MNKQNNDYNKKSKPLIIYLKIELFVKNICNNLINIFSKFYTKNKLYVNVLMLLGLIKFNVITIVIEFIAYYLYFAVSFDMVSIYTQIIKLISDIYAIYEFTPLVVRIIIYLKIVDVIRCNIAVGKLQHYERKNCGFINERPIISLITGTMGKNKTTLITDMALSQEKIFRNKAFEIIYKNDLKYIKFPWINLENFINHGIKQHIIFNLYTVKDVIQKILKINEMDIEIKTKKSILRHYKRVYGYKYQDFMFGYEYSSLNDLIYNNGIVTKNIYETIINYAKAYYLYIMNTSLILSNYSIRTDNKKSTNGNFPIWNFNFFGEIYINKYSHILDFDALRLGKVMNESNVQKNSFDFGVVNITEFAKERKNQLELNDVKKKDVETNQKNDGFNAWLKMVRHSATIDFYPFVKVITDDQRADSISADIRELCDIVNIEDKSDKYNTLPLFFINEIIYEIVYNRFKKIYYEYRYNRGDNTLIMYIIKKISGKIINHYEKLANKYGYTVLKLSVENGKRDTTKQSKYYLMDKKIFSNRFKTDCFNDFFDYKNSQSDVGLNDIPTYSDTIAFLEELRKQNSFFVNDLLSNFKFKK